MRSGGPRGEGSLRQRLHEEGKGSELVHSSSSTDTCEETGVKEKDDQRKESMVIAKLLEMNLRKEAEGMKRAGKGPREPPRQEDREQEDSDGFEPGRTVAG